MTNTVIAFNTKEQNENGCKLQCISMNAVPLVVELRRKKLSMVLLTFFNGGRGRLDIINYYCNYCLSTTGIVHKKTDVTSAI